MKYAPPKPEVLYLPTIFREIRTGSIRIPAFQRGFVWNQRQILELLESVLRGYPIGSLLFWQVDSDTMRTDTSSDLPFPLTKAGGTVDFVLDGMQRVSSLFGAFHERDGVVPEADPFAVVYDLRNEVFLPCRSRTEASINLRNVFRPRAMLAEHARIGGLDDGDQLIDRALELQQVFQEYLVPVVRIGDRSAGQVVEIFERVNSTGTKLGAVDFMRALTWSSEFDLNHALEDLQALARSLGYSVPKDTLAKSIALSMKIVPTSDEMIKLRERGADELLKATEATRTALRVACAYLSSELGLNSYDYVPYEGQFLVLMATSGAHPDGQIPLWFMDWFWSVGFSETLQGTPDHQVARMALAAGDGDSLVNQFGLTAESMTMRGIRKGAALAMTTLSALAQRPVFGVLSGRELEDEDVLAGYHLRMMGSVFSLDELRDRLDPPPRSHRLLPNTVLLSHGERTTKPTPMEIRASIVEFASSGDHETLLSQCIDADCVRAIRDDSPSDFLKARARALLTLAEELSGAVI